MGRVQRVAEDQILSSLLLLNERSFLLNMSRLTDALDERFDDLDEVKDVANHGCAAGVSGFIYYSETRAFFLEHEDDIEDKMDELYFGDNYIKEITDDDTITINGLMNKIVWIIVENYCQTRIQTLELYMPELVAA